MAFFQIGLMDEIQVGYLGNNIGAWCQPDVFSFCYYLKITPRLFLITIYPGILNSQDF